MQGNRLMVWLHGLCTGCCVGAAFLSSSATVRSQLAVVGSGGLGVCNSWACRGWLEKEIKNGLPRGVRISGNKTEDKEEETSTMYS